MNDPYRRDPPQGAGGPQGNDPLAELARLIGQTDPFAESGRGNGRQQSAQPDRSYSAAARPQTPVHPDLSAYRTPPAEPANPYAAPQSYPPTYAQPVGQSEQGYPPQAPAYREPQFSGENDGYQPPFDGASYAAGAPDAHGYQPDLYYQDDGEQAQSDDEMYDDAPPPRRRGMMLTVMAILCLAVVGTAGAFAYRSFFGSRSIQPPPVIKADTTPTKVVPPVQTSDSQANKLSYDRVGDKGTGERVVTREEQPVQVKDSSPPPVRAVFPPVASPTDATVATAAPPPAGIMSEPKRVRTIPIRPDLSSDPNASPPAPQATAPAPSPVPVQPRAVASRPVVAPPSAPAPARVANAPLSLAPQAVNEQPARAAAPTQLASNAPAGGGGYLVQVSSQRSESDAQASFRSLQAKYPNQLGSRQAFVKRADLGEKGTYYRSMIGPFGSAEEAGQLCGDLKAAGGQCIIQRN